jgi:hypothetical protein
MWERNVVAPVPHRVACNLPIQLMRSLNAVDCDWRTGCASSLYLESLPYSLLPTWPSSLRSGRYGTTRRKGSVPKASDHLEREHRQLTA